MDRKLSAKKKQILFVCLLLLMSEKNNIGKHELAGYNGKLIEPYGFQYPRKDQLNKTLTSCMGDSCQQKSIGTSKDLSDCFLYTIDGWLHYTIIFGTCK